MHPALHLVSSCLRRPATSTAAWHGTLLSHVGNGHPQPGQAVRQPAANCGSQGQHHLRHAAVIGWQVLLGQGEGRRIEVAAGAQTHKDCGCVRKLSATAQDCRDWVSCRNANASRLQAWTLAAQLRLPRRPLQGEEVEGATVPNNTPVPPPHKHKPHSCITLVSTPCLPSKGIARED